MSIVLLERYEQSFRRALTLDMEADIKDGLLKVWDEHETMDREILLRRLKDKLRSKVFDDHYTDFKLAATDMENQRRVIEQTRSILFEHDITDRLCNIDVQDQCVEDIDWSGHETYSVLREDLDKDDKLFE